MKAMANKRDKGGVLSHHTKWVVVLLALSVLAGLLQPADAQAANRPTAPAPKQDLGLGQLLPGDSDAEDLINDVLVEHPELKKAGADRPVRTTSSGDDLAIEVRVPSIAGLAAASGSPMPSPLKTDGGTFTLVAKNANGTIIQNSETREVARPQSGVTSVVETTEFGARVFEVLERPGSQRDFEYEAMHDGEALSFWQAPNGVIHVGQPEDAGFTSIGTVEAPWGYDADGAVVTTTYSISDDGRTLTMHVRPGLDAKYPVVADPSVTFSVGKVHCSWWTCTFYLERRTTRWLWMQSHELSTAAFTTLLGHIICFSMAHVAVWTGWVGFATGAACALAVAGVAWKIQREVSGFSRCLTFKKPHWDASQVTLFLPHNIGHASARSSHCLWDPK